MTTVVDIRDVAQPGQPLPDDVIYIGRRVYRGGWSLDASPWANPYRPQIAKGPYKTLAATVAVALYVQWLEDNLQQPHWREALEQLRGKRLACWCGRPRTPCHGDALVQALKEAGL